jgi:hypothetical protein
MLSNLWFPVRHNWITRSTSLDAQRRQWINLRRPPCR